MNFYHNLIVKKSWELLKTLNRKYKFILIGGWAVFLYTKALKSKDLDLVLSFDELEKLKEEFEVFKNERLKKYEARVEEIEVDIYTPFYSNLGLPAEDIQNFVIVLEGFKVPQKEILAILKQKALLARKESVKGRKDLADLISLFRLKDFDWEKYHQIIKNYKLKNWLKTTYQIIKQTRVFEELGLNIHQTASLKRKILTHLT